MNKIKESINEELKSLEATDELKRRTMARINQPKAKVIRFKGNYLKAMTLVSTFVIVLTLGINLLFQMDQKGTMMKNDMTPYSNGQFEDKNSDDRINNYLSKSLENDKEEKEEEQGDEDTNNNEGE